MSPGEAESFLSRFVAASDEVIGTMADRLRDLSGLDPAALDESTSSLPVLWEAIGPLVADIDEVGLERFAVDPPPLWWREDDHRMKYMNRGSLWLRDGVIHYAMRCRLAESDGLWLEWERNQDYETANQPCIVGYVGGRNRTHPISFGLSAYRSALSAARGGASPVWGSDSTAVFVGALGLGADLIPEPGAERVEPVWFADRKPFELSDVDVSLPTFRELEHWLDELDHDWDGAWLVQLPTKAVIDISPGPEYVGILEEALTGIDGVRRAAWVEDVVYVVDAPNLNKRKLRKSVLSVLNNFRSGYG